METGERRTVIVHGRPIRELRLAAARQRRHGMQVKTFEQLAARLAGGMSQAIDDNALRANAVFGPVEFVGVTEHGGHKSPACERPRLVTA